MAPRATAARMYATSSFAAQREGETVVILPGTALPANDPAVRAHPDRFTDQPPPDRRSPAEPAAGPEPGEIGHRRIGDLVGHELEDDD